MLPTRKFSCHVHSAEVSYIKYERQTSTVSYVISYFIQYLLRDSNNLFLSPRYYHLIEYLRLNLFLFETIVFRRKMLSLVYQFGSKVLWLAIFLQFSHLILDNCCIHQTRIDTRWCFQRPITLIRMFVITMLMTNCYWSFSRLTIGVTGTSCYRIFILKFTQYKPRESLKQDSKC